jgi:hypothetical protein
MEKAGAPIKSIGVQNSHSPSKLPSFLRASRVNKKRPYEITGDLRSTASTQSNIRDATAGLTQTAWGIGGIRSGGHCFRALTLWQTGRSRLRQTDAAIQFEMFLAATRTVTFAILLIAQAGEFVAAADAVTVAGE